MDLEKKDLEEEMNGSNPNKERDSERWFKLYSGLVETVRLRIEESSRTLDKRLQDEWNILSGQLAAINTIIIENRRFIDESYQLRGEVTARLKAIEEELKECKESLDRNREFVEKALKWRGEAISKLKELAEEIQNKASIEHIKNCETKFQALKEELAQVGKKQDWKSVLAMALNKASIVKFIFILAIAIVVLFIVFFLKVDISQVVKGLK